LPHYCHVAALSDEEVQAMFAEHGTVNSCIIMRDDDGKSKVSWAADVMCTLCCSFQRMLQPLFVQFIVPRFYRFAGLWLCQL
jgi:hypothetical protein